MTNKYNIDPETRIRMVCRSCGIDDTQTNGWRAQCGLHGGEVCISCCMKCEHMSKFSGLYKCTYKTPMQIRAEAAKRAVDRFEEENRKINEAIETKRKQKAREYAIKMNKARQKEKKRKVDADQRRVNDE